MGIYLIYIHICICMTQLPINVSTYWWVVEPPLWKKKTKNMKSEWTIEWNNDIHVPNHQLVTSLCVRCKIPRCNIPVYVTSNHCRKVSDGCFRLPLGCCLGIIYIVNGSCKLSQPILIFFWETRWFSLLFWLVSE